MRFHITYSPLGTLLSYHLRQNLAANHSVSLVYKTRPDLLAAVDAGNVVRMEHAGMIMTARNIHLEALSQKSGRGRLNKFKPNFAPIIEDNPTPIDSLIITDRPSATPKIIKALIHRLSVKSTIVLMQNGLGVYENIISTLFPNPKARPHFILAHPGHELWQKDHNHVVHTRAKPIFFSIVPDPKGRDFEATLCAQDVPRLGRSLVLRDIVMSPDDPQLAEYATLYNTVAVLNRLTDLHVSWIPMEEGEVMFRRDAVIRSIVDALAVWLNCRNGKIFKTAEARKLGHVLCLEASSVFKAQWDSELKSSMASSPHDTLPGFPTGLRKKNLMTDCMRFAFATRADIAPMLRDLNEGKRTEVQSGLGYLLDVGDTYRVHVPTIRTLYRMIRARESIIGGAL